MGDFGKITEIETAAGYYFLGDLLDTSTAERQHICQLLLTSKGSRARPLRKILESRAGPNIQPEKQSSLQSVDIFAKLSTNATPKGIGEILRPRQEVADPSSAAFHIGRPVYSVPGPEAS